MGILPAEVGIVKRLRGLDMIRHIRTVVAGARRGKGQPVGIAGRGVQHLEGGQLDGLPPPCMHLQLADPPLALIAPKDVAGIGSRRPAADRPVVGTANERLVIAQSCRQLEDGAAGGRYRHFLLGIEGEVVERWQGIVAVFAPCGSIAHIIVVRATPRITAAGIVGTDLHEVAHGTELPRPLALEVQRPVQGLGVVVALHIPIARRP